MNYGPNMQEIIVLDDDSKDMEVEQASEGEFLVFEGEDPAESDQEVIAISEGSDDMGGEAAKEESSKENRSSSDGSSDDSEEDPECPESSESKLEGHGWYDPAEVERHARLDNLVEKVCEELRLRYGKERARVDELWEEFAEMAKSKGNR